MALRATRRRSPAHLPSRSSVQNPETAPFLDHFWTKNRGVTVTWNLKTLLFIHHSSTKNRGVAIHHVIIIIVISIPYPAAPGARVETQNPSKIQPFPHRNRRGLRLADPRNYQNFPVSGGRSSATPRSFRLCAFAPLRLLVRRPQLPERNCAIWLVPAWKRKTRPKSGHLPATFRPIINAAYASRLNRIFTGPLPIFGGASSAIRRGSLPAIHPPLPVPAEVSGSVGPKFNALDRTSGFAETKTTPFLHHFCTSFKGGRK
jgi:hypothetical protein